MRNRLSGQIDVMGPVPQRNAADPFQRWRLAAGGIALEDTEDLQSGAGVRSGVRMALEHGSNEMVSAPVETASLRQRAFEGVIGDLDDAAGHPIEA